MPRSPKYRGARSERRRERSASTSDHDDKARSRRYRADHDQRDDRRDGRLTRDHRSRSRERARDSAVDHRHGRSPQSRQTDRSHTRVRSRSRSPPRKSRGPLPSQNDSFRHEVGLPNTEQAQKQKPNFKPTGLLAKEANTVAGTTTVLKYHEPAEARRPPASQQWRMYVFKQKDLVDTIYLFERSCWLIGRDQKITDLYLEHPSISKQHAVIQFRHSTTTNEFGDKVNRVKPYLIDLESANGTKLNDKKIGESRYVELVDSDVISFGNSEREYVMMLPAPEKK